MNGWRVLAVLCGKTVATARCAIRAAFSGATHAKARVHEHSCRPLDAGGDIAARCPYPKYRDKVAGLVLLVLSCFLAGCVSKATAEARARAAFLAGQQREEAIMARQNRIQGPTVTILGPVRNTLVPWTAELTLAKAVLAADYYGKRDPSAILIQRGGKEFRYDPKTLLGGQDIPLEPNDVIEIAE